MTNGKMNLTLTEDDISSQPVISRRALLSTLGIGAGVAAAVAFPGSLALAADPEGMGRGCRYLDNDWSVRPQDKARANCGTTDNDTRDRNNRSKTCGYRDN